MPVCFELGALCQLSKCSSTACIVSQLWDYSLSGKQREKKKKPTRFVVTTRTHVLVCDLLSHSCDSIFLKVLSYRKNSKFTCGYATAFRGAEGSCGGEMLRGECRRGLYSPACALQGCCPAAAGKRHLDLQKGQHKLLLLSLEGMLQT